MLQDNEMVTYDARNQMPYMQVCMKNKLAVGPKKQKEASNKVKEKEKAFSAFWVFKKLVLAEVMRKGASLFFFLTDLVLIYHTFV